jgi:hypothetical protein
VHVVFCRVSGQRETCSGGGLVEIIPAIKGGTIFGREPPDRVCHYWRDFVLSLSPPSLPPAWSPKSGPMPPKQTSPYPKSASSPAPTALRMSMDLHLTRKSVQTWTTLRYVFTLHPSGSSFIDTASSQLFRKEAIFRRMRHYSREHDRSQSRVAELERRKNTCEAGLAAMAACWTQVSYRFVAPTLIPMLFAVGRSNPASGKTGRLAGNHS